MKVIIEISTNNAAFQDNPQGEFNRILERIKGRLDVTNEGTKSLQDINGNTVGTAVCVAN